MFEYFDKLLLSNVRGQQYAHINSFTHDIGAVDCICVIGYDCFCDTGNDDIVDEYDDDNDVDDHDNDIGTIECRWVIDCDYW